jgi:rare lipoprotein A
MVPDAPVVTRKVGLLAGRHAAPRTPKKVRYLVPLTAAALVAAVLVAVSVTTGGLGGTFASNDATVAEPPAAGQASQASASASPSTVLSPTASRSPQRPSRAEARSPRPSPSPSRSRTPRPSRSASRASTVVDSGTCGVSYYDTGSTTANGEPFDPDGLTAAHKTLPFDTRVRVTNTANGESVVVRINDRGPFVSGRCIDLARGAFTTIASLSSGVITAKYEVLS